MALALFSYDMRIKRNIALIGTVALVLIFMAGRLSAQQLKPEQKDAPQQEEHTIKKVLFLGDSMTGWLAERMNEYGKLNDFEVATVVWDGSTINKWGTTQKLKQIINREKPDAIFISLGMNELFERNPETRLGKSVDNILSAFGDIPYVWIGPPTWPGKKGGSTLNKWLAEKVGTENYYNSTSLSLPRQSKVNPHPTREGMVKWMDNVVEWLPESRDSLLFKSLDRPAGNKMSRGKTYIYKKMKEAL